MAESKDKAQDPLFFNIDHTPKNPTTKEEFIANMVKWFQENHQGKTAVVALQKKAAMATYSLKVTLNSDAIGDETCLTITSDEVTFLIANGRALLTGEAEEMLMLYNPDFTRLEDINF
jgi:hypothetical protein